MDTLCIFSFYCYKVADCSPEVLAYAFVNNLKKGSNFVVCLEYNNFSFFVC